MVICEGEDGLEAVFLAPLNSTPPDLPVLTEEEQKQLQLAKKATKGKVSDNFIKSSESLP